MNQTWDQSLKACMRSCAYKYWCRYTQEWVSSGYKHDIVMPHLPPSSVEKIIQGWVLVEESHGPVGLWKRKTRRYQRGSTFWLLWDPLNEKLSWTLEGCLTHNLEPTRAWGLQTYIYMFIFTTLCFMIQHFEAVF